MDKQSIEGNVRLRLENLGFKTDGIVSTEYLGQIIEKTLDYIKSECGQVPDELFYAIVDMVCGDILTTYKKAFSEDMSDNIVSIKEGDTTITYGNEKYNQAISVLSKSKALIANFRCVKW